VEEGDHRRLAQDHVFDSAYLDGYRKEILPEAMAIREELAEKLFNGLCCKRSRADLVRCIVARKRPALFRGRHFEDAIILLCVRWYLRYSLTYRDLEEIMAERGLSVDHVTIWRWVQRYAPVLNQRIRREMRHPNRSWRVDETYVKVAGIWTYLYRAVDSAGEAIEFLLSPKRDLIAAKLFLRLALSGGGPPPRVINVDGHPALSHRGGRVEAVRRTRPTLPLPNIALLE
jgi:transposase-like protein